MKANRQRSTGSVQEDRLRTWVAEDEEATPWLQAGSFHLIRPADERQSRPSSQSRRMSPGGSSSYWSPSEVAVAGSPMRFDEPASSFQLVKAWDGIVTNVTDTTLIVRIVPLDGSGLEEEAEFLVTDVPEEDQPLIKRGAPLFWFLGYETSRGRRRRTSELKMRRLNLPEVPSEKWMEAIEAIVVAPGEGAPTEG